MKSQDGWSPLAVIVGVFAGSLGIGALAFMLPPDEAYKAAQEQRRTGKTAHERWLEKWLQEQAERGR